MKNQSNHKPWAWRISPRKTVAPLGKFSLFAVFISHKVVPLYAGAFPEMAKGHSLCLGQMEHHHCKTGIFFLTASHS